MTSDKWFDSWFCLIIVCLIGNLSITLDQKPCNRLTIWCFIFLKHLTYKTWSDLTWNPNEDSVFEGQVRLHTFKVAPWCQMFCTRWRLGLFPAVSKLCLCHMVVNTRSCSVKCKAQTILPRNCFPLRLLKSAVCVTRLFTWHKTFIVCGSSGRSWELENVPSDLKMLSFYSRFFFFVCFLCFSFNLSEVIRL